MKQFVNSGIRRALVLKNTIMTPNKPNSGKRQVVQVVIPKWRYKWVIKQKNFIQIKEYFSKKKNILRENLYSKDFTPLVTETNNNSSYVDHSFAN